MSENSNEKMSNYLEVYEVTGGTVVSIQLKDKVLRGECSVQLAHDNSKTPSEDRVILDQPLELPTGKKHEGTISFAVNEIRNIEVIEIGLFRKKGDQADDESQTNQSAPGVTVPSSKSSRKGASKAKKNKLLSENKDIEPIEIQLRTYVIRDPFQLKVLTKLLRDIDVCGISFEGQNVGRNGIVTWIILTAGKTLIPFDVDVLYEQTPDLWKTLDKYIFRNEKLVKILHDGRAAADYLWHVHGIKMLNVFDTQVSDAIIAKDHLGYAPPQLSSLSDCLQMYNRRIPLEEFDFLRKYEDMDFSTNSPFLLKPIPPPEYLKLCAIKVKHLVPLRENMMVKLMERQAACVEAHLNALKDQDNQQYLTEAQKRREISPGLLDMLENNLGQLIV